MHKASGHLGDNDNYVLTKVNEPWVYMTPVSSFKWLYCSGDTRHKARAGSSLNDLQLFFLPEHQRQQLRSRRAKIFTLLTNEHRYSGCDSSRGLPSHTLSQRLCERGNDSHKGSDGEHACTNKHTHTPLSVLTFWFCGTDLHRGENSCFLVFALILYLICCFKTTALDSV